MDYGQWRHREGGNPRTFLPGLDRFGTVDFARGVTGRSDADAELVPAQHLRTRIVGARNFRCAGIAASGETGASGGRRKPDRGTLRASASSDEFCPAARPQNFLDAEHTQLRRSRPALLRSASAEAVAREGEPRGRAMAGRASGSQWLL